MPMKVTPDHARAFEEAIKPLDTPELRAKYRVGDFPRSDFVTDLDKRYRWDLFWLAQEVPQVRDIMTRTVYKEAHLDPVLRRCVRSLEHDYDAEEA